MSHLNKWGSEFLTGWGAARTAWRTFPHFRFQLFLYGLWPSALLAFLLLMTLSPEVQLEAKLLPHRLPTYGDYVLLAVSYALLIGVVIGNCKGRLRVHLISALGFVSISLAVVLIFCIALETSDVLNSMSTAIDTRLVASSAIKADISTKLFMQCLIVLLGLSLLRRPILARRFSFTAILFTIVGGINALDIASADRYPVLQISLMVALSSVVTCLVIGFGFLAYTPRYRRLLSNAISCTVVTLLLLGFFATDPVTLFLISALFLGGLATVILVFDGLDPWSYRLRPEGVPSNSFEYHD